MVAEIGKIRAEQKKILGTAFNRFGATHEGSGGIKARRLKLN